MKKIIMPTPFETLEYYYGNVAIIFFLFFFFLLRLCLGFCLSSSFLYLFEAYWLSSICVL